MTKGVSIETIWQICEYLSHNYLKVLYVYMHIYCFFCTEWPASYLFIALVAMTIKQIWIWILTWNNQGRREIMYILFWFFFFIFIYSIHILFLYSSIYSLSQFSFIFLFHILGSFVILFCIFSVSSVGAVICSGWGRLCLIVKMGLARWGLQQWMTDVTSSLACRMVFIQVQVSWPWAMSSTPYFPDLAPLYSV